MPAQACWWYEGASSDVPQVWCYTDDLSYQVGEEVALHVHTTASSFNLVVYRDGLQREVVHRVEDLRGEAHETPEDCSETGCGWPVSHRFSVGSEWRSGGYVVVVTAETGGRSVRHEHWFAVRPLVPQRDALILMAATSTWIAYNSWGGSNAYEGIWGTENDRLAPVLSLQRPWGRGMAWLPEGAPRLCAPGKLPVGWVPRYEAIEWALANGFPKYYATNGWAMYERHFVRWAEACGYTVNVITQHDLHFRPEVIESAPLVTVVGHDEYWSWEMRDHLENYLSQGGRMARFAGNMGWQVRLEENGRAQRCHKHFAGTEDPVMESAEEQHLLTSWWDDRRIGRPIAETFGVTGTQGMYTRVGGFNPRHSGGFTVYQPRHWAFDGCDAYYGDQFGAQSGVFGFEVDGLDYEIRNGIPTATGRDGVDPASVEIIALSPAALIEEDHGNEGTQLFVGAFDCEFMATAVHGEATPEAVDELSRGCGVISEHSVGKGRSFSAASCEWVVGLAGGDPAVERLTRNVLDRYLGGEDDS
ncbi:hypothetical protein CWI75_07950 [Kineobactrum sediminis]|uniref:N,N-dimethylformamidase beta subunit-like C-terminal domain-containing protein n=2 Tax=Kineobactrum sediminis TaxID=1905677 RepID=A0A2N5Y4K3_9GAMM|nr:hypothetical protein CWI75_07950 [Kineobactrum sediminis]